MGSPAASLIRYFLGLLIAGALTGVAWTDDAERLATARSMLQLASGYMQRGRPADALRLLEKALSVQRKILGVDHEQTQDSMGLLSATLISLGAGGVAQPDCARIPKQLALVLTNLHALVVAVPRA